VSSATRHNGQNIRRRELNSGEQNIPPAPRNLNRINRQSPRSVSTNATAAFPDSLNVKKLILYRG
jgi:hypothetical protein